MTAPAVRGCSKFLILEFPGDESGTGKDGGPVSDAAKGGLLESGGDFRSHPGLVAGAWEAPRGDKAPGSGDRRASGPRRVSF